MTLSIVVPGVQFPKRTQIYDIPALNRNHVFSVFGASQNRSLVNLNISEVAGVIVGNVAFSSEGANIVGNTNAIRFKGFNKSLNTSACTLMALFKTGPALGDAGVISLWSEATMSADTYARRINTTISGSTPVYNSTPTPSSTATTRPVAANTEYILSMTRSIQGAASLLRLHNTDGSVALVSPIAEYVGTALPYAADTVFDIGISSSAAQKGVFMKGAALWTGVMTDAEITSAASLMYQITR